MNYFYKKMLMEYHLLPKDIDGQDYFEFLEVINAKAPEDQMVDSMEIYKQNS